MATAVATVLSIPEKLDFRVKKATEAGTGYKLPKSYNASYVNHMNKRLATGAYKLVGTKLFFVKKEDRVALETSEAPVQTAGVEAAPATGEVAVKKPECQLVGQDGNVFNLIGIVSKTLKKAGLPDKATEMSHRCFGAGSYGEALNIMGEYVDIS